MLIVRIAILSLNIWPINGDEAQYWNWGQNLAWGYYSKPPMIAWVIALTNKLFGNGPVGLRLGSPLAYCFAGIFVYLSGCRLFSTRVGFWSGLMFILLPGVTYSSSIISTDPILLAFWSGALYGVIRALEKNECRWWLFASVMLGLGFYSKYAAALFTLSFVLFLLSSKNYRILLKSSGPYCLLIFPLILLIPNILWNAQHHFASVNAVAANADLSSQLFHPMNFLNFVAAQLGVFGPIFFITLLLILFTINQYIKTDNYRLLLTFTFVTLGIMTVESLLSRAHANWSAPAYVAGTILVCAVLIERKKIVWLWLSLAINLLILVGFVNIQGLVHSFHIPLDHEMTITGWPTATQEIIQIRSQYPEARVMSDNRMLLTQLMYFANIKLNQVVKWNPSGEIGDQYDMVTTMQGTVGKNFLLFTYQKYPVTIESAFSNSRLIQTINLMTLDGHTLPLYVFYLVGFKGYV